MFSADSVRLSLLGKYGNFEEGRATVFLATNGERKEGWSTVFLATNGERKEISISLTKDPYCKLFTAYIKDNGEKRGIGRLEFQRFHIKKDGNYGSQNLPKDRMGSHGYGSLAEAVSKISVSLIESYFSQYKGVGTALMQAAMEYGYSRGCEGRIDVTTAWSSPSFFYTLGMKARDHQRNEELKKWLEELAAHPGERDICEWSSFYMYMPEEGIDYWKEKIARQPVFACTVARLIEQRNAPLAARS